MRRLSGERNEVSFKQGTGMSQYLQVNPVSPEPNFLNVIVESLREGAVIAYPTDSGYALGCMMGLLKPLVRICKIRKDTYQK